jgi:uncharacterized membrane protein YtjA (UPF0391 family)
MEKFALQRAARAVSMKQNYRKLMAYPLQKHNANAQDGNRKGGIQMLSWSLTFLVIGLIAAVLGFSGVAGAATQIAWVLFVVFLVLFLVSLFVGRGRTPL